MGIVGDVNLVNVDEIGRLSFASRNMLFGIQG